MTGRNLEAIPGISEFREIKVRDHEVYIKARPWIAEYFHYIKHKNTELPISRMDFDAYAGPEHLCRFFNWLEPANYWFYFDSQFHRDLCEKSAANDHRVLLSLNLLDRVNQTAIDKTGQYNAQDYIMRQPYPLPERQHVQTLLEFGAGHGRSANLFFEDPAAKLMIAVDSIEASYLTQCLYYHELGIRCLDYVSSELTADDFVRRDGSPGIIHLPTWRMDLVPNQSVDMVSCVQVLRELSPALAIFALRQFARVLKVGGGLYLRDHGVAHNPNGVDLTRMLQAAGFVLEFCPHVRRNEIHGVPQIWRKAMLEVYV